MTTTIQNLNVTGILNAASFSGSIPIILSNGTGGFVTKYIMLSDNL